MDQKSEDRLLMAWYRVINVKGQTVQPADLEQKHKRMDATKYIISFALRSIIILYLYHGVERFVSSDVGAGYEPSYETLWNLFQITLNVTNLSQMYSKRWIPLRWSISSVKLSGSDVETRKVCEFPRFD